MDQNPGIGVLDLVIDADGTNLTVDPDSVQDEGETPLKFENSSAAGGTRVAAIDDDVQMAEMNIAIRTEREPKVRFFILNDTGSHGDNKSLTDKGDKWNEMVEIWHEQSVVNPDENIAQQELQIPKNLGASPTMNTLINEVTAALSADIGLPSSEQDQVYVIVTWDIADAAAFEYGRLIFVKPSSDAITLAHELGHAIGFSGHAEEVDTLMGGYGGTPSTKRILKTHTDIVNPN